MVGCGGDGGVCKPAAQLLKRYLCFVLNSLQLCEDLGGEHVELMHAEV